MKNKENLLLKCTFPLDAEFRIRKQILSEDFSIHCHDCFEIEIITNGNGIQNLNGKVYPLKKGCAYIIKPTDFHSVTVSEPLHIYNIIFTERMLSDTIAFDIAGFQNNCFAFLSQEDCEQLSRLVKILLYEFENSFNMKSVVIKNLLECIALLIIRNSDFKGGELQNSALQTVLSFIHLNYRSNPALEKAAESVNFSSSYFSGWFKKSTGKSYTEYLNHLKLSYAKNRLLTSSDSITEICFTSGFNSLSGFLKEFKKKFGAAPSVYRKNILSKT